MPLEEELTHYAYCYSDTLGIFYEKEQLKVVKSAVESVFRETGFVPTLQGPGIQEPGSDGIDRSIIQLTITADHGASSHPSRKTCI